MNDGAVVGIQRSAAAVVGDAPRNPARRDADHSDRMSIDMHRLPNHRRIGAETCTPHAIADDDGLTAAGYVRRPKMRPTAGVVPNTSK